MCIEAPVAPSGLDYLQVSSPRINDINSLQMMVSNLDFDQHKGRLAIGRIISGSLIKGQTIAIARSGMSVKIPSFQICIEHFVPHS